MTSAKFDKKNEIIILKTKIEGLFVTKILVV